MIRITCGNCGAKYQVPDAVGGKTTRCTKCRETIQIPPAASQAPAAAASAAASPSVPGGVSAARPVEPARPSAPAPAPAGNSAADALAALTEAGRPAAAAPAPPPAFSPEAPAPASSRVPPVAVETPAPPLQSPVAEAPVYQPSPAAPRKSYAVLITVIVIGAVLITMVVGGVLLVKKIIPERNARSLVEKEAKEKQEKEDKVESIVTVFQADVDIANDLAKAALKEAGQVEKLDPVALDDAGKKLADAKAKNEDLTNKLEHLNLPGQKGKDLLAGLEDSQKKIAESMERVDAALWPGPGTPKEMIDRVRPSIPQIIIPPPPGAPAEVKFLSSGSGFLLQNAGKWCVATNRHVVTGGKDGLTLIFRPLGSTDTLEIKVPAAAITKIHKFTDLAVIELTDKDAELLKKNNIRPLPINPADEKDKPAAGDYCWVFGHPGGDTSAGEGIQSNTFGDGAIANILVMPGFLDCLEITAPINPGNSGGPLFNKFGRVIGQVTFYRKDKDRQNYAVDVSLLRGLLNPDPGDDWTVDAAEIHRILSPAEALKEDYAEAVKEMDKQGFVQVPLTPRQRGAMTIDNTAVNQIPLVLTDAKPYKVVVITCWTAVLNLYVGKGAQLAIAPVLKNNCVWLPVDVPAGPGNLILAIVNDHLGLHTPCIVALFKKK